MTDEALATAITDSLQGQVTLEQTNLVLAALNAVGEGEPLGTIRRDPTTGGVAYRVTLDGLNLWRVTLPDGSTYNDQQPTLPAWDLIAEGT